MRNKFDNSFSKGHTKIPINLLIFVHSYFILDLNYCVLEMLLHCFEWLFYFPLHLVAIELYA